MMNTTQPSLRLFAPAKINWSLTIERKREDGFHDLDTVFQTLSWGDELICRPLAEPVCRIECSAPDVPTGADNLVAKAWRQLAEAYPERVRGLAVRLIKRIPAGAGLGGGSSDAAAALVALNRLYGLRLDRSALERHSAALGSDCAFFIRGGTAMGQGRGERLEPLPNRLPPLWLVLVYPGFPSSTAEAYGRVTPAHWQDGQVTRQVAQAIAAGDLVKLQNTTENVFYTIAINNDQRYKKLKSCLERGGLTYPLLSGSGSTMFAYARSADHARQACEQLRQEYPLAISARLRRTGIGTLMS